MSETHEENKALNPQAKINEDINEQIKQIVADAKEGEELRISVYVCQCGGNISDVVRTDLVAKEMAKLPNVVVSHDHIFMCADSGQELIRKDIAEKGINRVVIGSCSPFLHEQTFRRAVASAGLNPYLYTHVGIREQSSWVHHDSPNEATELSARLMASGIAKARLLDPLESIKIEAKQYALVVGGGVSGLQAALSIAKAGLKVVIVEKSHFLGGRMSQWDHVFPTDDDARILLQGLIKEVLASPNITIHTGTEITVAKGYIGDFNVHCKQMPRGVAENLNNLKAAMDICPVEVVDEFNFGLSKRKAIYRPYEGCVPSGAVIDWKNCTKCGKCQEVAGAGKIDLTGEPVEFDLNVGAIVVATGFTPYEPYQGEFGYGEIPEVITLPQLERLLSVDGPTKGKLEWNGHPIHSMAMIHCVGSRQLDGVHQPQPDGKVNEYCSRVCCTATLSAANHIHKQLPNVAIFDVYQDIRTYGRGHEEYYVNASKNRVTFLRYYGDEIPEVKQAPAGEKYPILVKVKDHLTSGNEIELPVDMVVLAVGMMPTPVQNLIEMLKISQGADRFLLEVHPKLRPVETAMAGIVLAGTAQGPMNIRESSMAGQAAASKVIALLNTGRVELEPYVVRVNAERCNGSGECVKYCPQEGAIRLETFTDDGKTFQRAVVSPANCNGCGVCVSVCPNRALSIQGWTLDQYDAMVAALTVDISELEGAL